MGTVRPNWPVAGSVTSAELTMSALRCSPEAEIRRSPEGERTTPGTSGRTSETVAGRPGRSRTVAEAIWVGVEEP